MGRGFSIQGQEPILQVIGGGGGGESGVCLYIRVLCTGITWVKGRQTDWSAPYSNAHALFSIAIAIPYFHEWPIMYMLPTVCRVHVLLLLADCSAYTILCPVLHMYSHTPVSVCNSNCSLSLLLLNYTSYYVAMATGIHINTSHYLPHT